jgi:hypothetical protein
MVAGENERLSRHDGVARRRAVAASIGKASTNTGQTPSRIERAALLVVIA